MPYKRRKRRVNGMDIYAIAALTALTVFGYGVWRLFQEEREQNLRELERDSLPYYSLESRVYASSNGFISSYTTRPFNHAV